MPTVRDTAIDALKGFLILLVILGHNGGSHPLVLELAHPTKMGMFFIVSGYLIHGKLKLKKRLRGTILPFLFFVVLSILWRYSYGFVSGETLEFQKWGIELLHGQDWGLNIPMWFLLSYCQLLIMVYILEKIPSSAIRWTAVMALMFAGLELLRNGINPLYVGRTLVYLPFFMIGGELHNISYKFPDGKYPFVTMLLIVILICGRSYLIAMDYYVRWFVDTALALIFAYLLYNLFKNKFFPSRIFAFYGKNSIVVLCLHILILDVVWRLWWQHFGQPDMVGALLQSLIIAILLYPCCLVYNKYIGPKLK